MNEEILEQIFRHTPVGVALTDLHGTIVEVNDALCTMAGYPREQVVGRAASSFLHPDDAAAADDLLSRFRDAGAGSRRALRRLISRCGKILWVAITVSVVRSKSDEPVCGLAFIEDISDRLAIEKELEKTAALYRQVVEDQTDMIVRWTPDGTRTFVNEAYSRFFGFSESDLIGTSFFPLVRDDRARIEARIRSLTPQSPSATGVHRIVLGDGSVRWTEWTDRATFDESGAIAMMQSTGRDVTDRVKATEALTISESRFRRLFEDLPIGAWEVDWSATVQRIRSAGIQSTQDAIRYNAAHPEEIAAAIARVRLCEVNAAGLRLAGVATPEEFHRWLHLSAPFVDRNVLIEAVGPLLFEGAETSRVELSLRTPSAGVRHVICNWTRVRQPEGWRVLTIVLDVTDERESERALRRSEQMYRDLFANLPVAVWQTDWSDALAGFSEIGIETPEQLVEAFRTDRDRVVEIGMRRRSVHANQNALNLFRVASGEELMRATWPPVVAPGQSASFALTLARIAFGKQQTAATELRITRPDGTTVDVDAMLSCSDAAPGHVISTAVDVTGAKQSRDALRHSEQRYRHLFHTLPVAVWETDWSGAIAELHERGLATPEKVVALQKEDAECAKRIFAERHVVDANQHALDLFGVASVPAFQKLGWPPNIAPSQFPILIRNLFDVAYGYVPIARFELTAHRTDGTLFDLDTTVSLSASGPGRLISTGVDISERKKIERDLLHSQMLLERAQTLAHLGSWELSIERDELFGSKEYWKILAGSDEGPRTRKLSDALNSVHAEDRALLMKTLVETRAAFVEGRRLDDVPEVFRVVHPDGNVRTVRGQGVYSRTAEGDIRGYGTLQDITEIRKAEEAVQRQREELMRADRMISLGVLVSGVAHEINNPNQFIMLNAPFLRNAWKDVAPVVDQYAREHPDFRVSGMRWAEMKREIPEIIAEIDRGADRIRSIVSELRAFGRDSGPAELRPSSLNEVIERSLRLMSNHIRRATSRFSLALEAGLPPVAANPQRLEQVIVNLVMNACQALTDPDQAITVRTSFDERAKSVVMRVVDEGRGIAAENLKKIRDPFFTTKRAEGGTGLGLAVCDRIVQEHNGILSFESEPGRGTTVSLSLPAMIDTER